jgi:hypothetical protein
MGVNVQPATPTSEPKSEEMVKEQLISSPPPQVERPEIAMPQTAKTSAPKDEIEDDTHMAPSPIITDPTKREYNKGFRLEDDERHVVRINQLQPKGFPKKIAEFITVAGITMENRDVVAKQFVKGKDRQIELRKQPDNPYDKNAIEVYGHWTKQGKSFTEKLGYLPSKVASKLVNEPELKATIKVMYMPTDETSVGIKIDVWTKMKKRVKVEEKPYVDMETPHEAVDRNIKGQELEKEGYIDNAIELYELNIKEEFEGNFPYDRLVILHRKRKKEADVIRVLEQGIKVFESLEKTSPRQDVTPKLNRFREQLSKIKVPSN